MDRAARGLPGRRTQLPPRRRRRGRRPRRVPRGPRRGERHRAAAVERSRTGALAPRGRTMAAPTELQQHATAAQTTAARGRPQRLRGWQEALAILVSYQAYEW